MIIRPIHKEKARFIKVILLVLVIFGAWAAEKSYGACRDFTPEQQDALDLAHEYGKEYNLEWTLPAIVWKESFVGPYIIRINPNDGKHGSYGVTHILLETAMYFEGIESSWKAKAVIAPRLMSDDEYALAKAVEKLESIETTSYMTKWMRYNGGNPEYAEAIYRNVRDLQDCGYFDNRTIFNN